ncbi:hypothetical protein BH11PSE4_BH11PSE4_25000 [soil metagenome]
MFSADRISSARREAFGRVNRVVPDAKLRTTAFAFARSLAEGAALAFAGMKDNPDHATSSDFLTSLNREASP